MNRLASLLAVVAVIAVLGSTVAAVAAYQGRGTTPVATDDPSESGTPTPTEPSSAEPSSAEPSVTLASPYAVFPDEQVVAGGIDDNATFEVPSAAEGWTIESADSTLYYGDPSGDGLTVGVAGPAVLDDGYCPSSDYSNRGFVGLTRSAEGDDVRRANTMLTDDWVTTISDDPDSDAVAEHTPVTTVDYPLPTGDVAVRSDTIITSFPDKCAAPRVAYTMVSLDTGSAIANLVMVRDLDAKGVLTDEVAEQILQTFQRQVLPQP